MAEYHVVESCRTVRDDSAWVQFLGYPKHRNCWRSVSDHFPAGADGVALGVPRARVRLSVVPFDGSTSTTRPVLLGRLPPARDIRACAVPRSATAAERQQQAAAKKRRRDYDTKVHTIRVGSSGIQEIRGVKRAGVTVSTGLPGCSCSQSDLGGPSAAAAPGAAPGAECHRGANGAEGSSDGHTTSAGDSANGHGASAAGAAKPSDEQSELWAAHRQINEAAWRPSGSMFRVEVTELVDSQVHAAADAPRQPAAAVAVVARAHNATV